MDISAPLIHFSPRFQRAVNVRYDLRNSDTIERYIPTFSALQALESVLKGTNSQATQRAHVLYAAYGSGKSLFAICLASLLENSPILEKSNRRLLDRIADSAAHVASSVEAYFESKQRLLPVVLSGDEGNFATAMIRALVRSLNDSELRDIQFNSRFTSALHILAHWDTSYPEAIRSLAHILATEARIELNDLKRSLELRDEAALNLFAEIYPRLTAGSQFERFSYEDTPEKVYQDIAAQLPDYGYTGIVVIWDEFGRYLEGRTAQVFSGEAALLQNFAEACNHSDTQQIHLVLFTHKELQSYANNLPKQYQQEWSRIEGRFQKHNITSDPNVAYRLVQASLEHPQPSIIQALLAPRLNEFVKQSADYAIFPSLDELAIQRLILRSYPLHPLSIFALVRLSNKIAQNERTMFTFLTVDEPNALQGLLSRLDIHNGQFIRLDALWDYFEEAIRADVGVGGAHRIWSGVVNALDKVTQDDLEAHALIKSLGVMLICSDGGSVRPTKEILSWATGKDEDETVNILQNLRRRKAVIERKVDGYWTFTSGSDVDFEQKLSQTLERLNPSQLQLRRLLESLYPAPATVARRYNQAHAITRYFQGIYRWADEINDAPWDTLMEQMGNMDGLVVYTLITDILEIEIAQKAITNNQRVVYVHPIEPLTQLRDLLRELYALQELSNDPQLKQHEDRERVRRELEWLTEDASLRLERELTLLLDPRKGNTHWIAVDGHSNVARFYEVTNSNHPASILSEVCQRVFSNTPVLNSEGLNKQSPTAQQLRAAEKLIEALFSGVELPMMGLEGNGPEILALNSILRTTKIIRQDNQGEWFFGRPDVDDDFASIGVVWDKIEAFFALSRQSIQPFSTIIYELNHPPYGIRLGILPVLLAAVLRRHLRVTTIRKEKRVVSVITGELFTDIVANSESYFIEMGEWRIQDERLWQSILTSFEAHILPVERRQQPLTLLPVILVRWLQSQSHFCRQTKSLDADALSFRDLIRQAQTEPAKVLFEALPRLLEIDNSTSEVVIVNRLTSIMSAISGAYLDLQRRLDTFTVQEFSMYGSAGTGFQALKGWLQHVGKTANLSTLRFGSLVTQQLVEVLLEHDSEQGAFWDTLSKALTGVYLRDWTDQSETRFCDTLRRARQEIEREVQQLIEEEKVVALTLTLPDTQPREYRFRSSDLSAQGKRLLQNFQSTLEIAGRPLSADEKRQIAVAFLAHVMGEDLGD